MLEYGSILYSSAVLSHVSRLDSLQSRIENMCGFMFPSLSDHRSASILGFKCRRLDGEGHGNLQTFRPSFKTTHRLSSRLHSFDPARHLHFQSPCNFRTLDRFRHSWQVTIVTLWDSIPAERLLQGDCRGWKIVLKDIQRTIMM